MKHTVALTGDRIDQIVYKYYGTLDVLNDVMQSNIHLISKPVLESGDVVYLPDIDTSEQSESGVALW